MNRKSTCGMRLLDQEANISPMGHDVSNQDGCVSIWPASAKLPLGAHRGVVDLASGGISHFTVTMALFEVRLSALCALQSAPMSQSWEILRCELNSTWDFMGYRRRAKLSLVTSLAVNDKMLSRRLPWSDNSERRAPESTETDGDWFSLESDLFNIPLNCGLFQNLLSEEMDLKGNQYYGLSKTTER
ncbi:hypothetical protein QQF64_022535 [Cirrhinus molitorella]|uniref:Uncharacterized protein n=1 Tax=Cirrhinus molitorella TaxID=172907 RepID=A0ABR3L2P4_9TELE